MSRKRTRKTPAPVAAPAVTATPAPEPLPEVAYDFYFLPPAEPVAVDETELLELIGDWRHGRATRTVWEALQDAYFTLFTVAVLGAMVVSVVLRSQSSAAACTTSSCLAARELLPLTVILAFSALALSMSRLFGPVLASAAEGSWLFEAPVGRTRLLGKRLRAAVIVGGLVTFAVVALVAFLSGSSLLLSGVWAAAGGLGTAALVAFAAAEQGRERTVLVTTLRSVFATLAAATAGVLVAISAGWFGLALGPAVTGLVAATWAVVSLALLIAGLLVAVRRLKLIKRTRLLSGGSLVSGMQGAMYALDFGLMRDILVERESYRRGRVQPTIGGGLGLSALIWRDFQRIRRFPKPLFGLLAAALVPYALAAMGINQLLPLLAGLALVGALVPFLQSLRVLSRTNGLRRMLPFKNTEIRQAAMVMPGVFTALWAVLTLPAFWWAVESPQTDAFRWLSVGLLTAFAGLMGAVRWVSAKKVDFNTPMVATEGGAMPPMLMLNLFRGLDMVALITAPILLGLSTLWALVIAIFVYFGMRGSFNMDELKAQERAAKQELAESKQAAGQKKVIQRGR